ncbi:MAG: hypothetical protein ACRDS9_23320 [Pseudonocardiaceae bacterium]
MSKRKARPGVAIAGIMLAAGALFAQVPSAAAAPATTSSTIAAPAAVPGQWYTYYEHYFYYESTCEARGRGMVENVNGIIAYRCWIGGGDTRWSMDVYDTNVGK